MVQGGQAKSLWRRDAEITLVSVLLLFLELVLIRWIGTEIRVFAYLGNLVLVICFFGAGLGCYLASRPVALNRMGINVLLLVALISNPLHVDWLDLRRITQLVDVFEDTLMFTRTVGWGWIHPVSGLALAGVLLYLVACVFVPCGQVLGRALQDHPRVIRAYSVNIAGSLVGVWLLGALSSVSAPPVWWFGTAAVLLGLLVAVRGQREWLAAGLVGVAAVATPLGNEPALRTVWSPYHKLSVSPLFAREGTNRFQEGYTIDVNQTFFQQMRNRSESFVRAHPDMFDRRTLEGELYTSPFWLKPSIRRMLIVGAGSGNNAADALRHGVEQVDCVEIDPQICALGKELHPERPYQSSRVHLIVQDARAFFKQATDRYDAIWFAWLDSHTLGSSYNNLRLDHFVYTRESFQEARRLLAEDGIIFVDFAAERPWIGDRLFVILKEVFGHDPLAYAPQGVSSVALIASDKPVKLGALSDPFLRSHMVAMSQTARPTTDDWPYLYLKQARVPTLHLLMALLVLGTVPLARRQLTGQRSRVDWHFFALGAAFLLLEVQTVSRATLLFGMTWVVNAIVISAVLVMILLSNLVALRWPQFPQWLIVVGLALTVAALALVPLVWFNALTGASKLVAASAFLTAPVFFAGLIFIRSFAVCADKSQALGSNLIGALVGGLLESVSFVTGIRALVLLVGLFYALALWLRLGRTQDAVAADQCP